MDSNYMAKAGDVITLSEGNKSQSKSHKNLFTNKVNFTSPKFF